MRKLLHEAQELPQILLDLDPKFGGPVQHDDFPSVTLGWLRTAAVLQYQAVVTLLAHPTCASEAELLLRPLLESFAHTVWIDEGVAGGGNRTARCCAVCLEFGIAQYRLGSLPGMRGLAAHEREELATGIRERVEQLRQLHAAEGCTCRGRRYSAAKTTIDTLSSMDARYDALCQQWDWSSSGLHVFEPNRMYRRLPDGNALIGAPIRPGWRATMLTLVINVLSELGSRTLRVQGVAPEAQARLTYWSAEFLERPPLRNALRGEFE